MPLTPATIPKDAKAVTIGFQKSSGGRGMLDWVVFEPEVTPEAGQIYWVSLKAGTVRIGYVVEFTGDEI